MHRKSYALTSLIKLAACTAVALGTFVSAYAADITGTYTWTRPARGGGEEQKMTLKLKADGEKLTGTLTQPGRNGQTADTEISDGTVKGDEIAFTVKRGQMSMKYSGKVSADAIKGKIETDRNGQTNSRDWEAKRAKADAK
jgi:hypothetical protein